MTPCVCGHWHAATCPHCGCSIYEPDNGRPQGDSRITPKPGSDPYTGIYGPRSGM